MALYKKAIGFDPKLGDAHLRLAVAYAKQNKKSDAVEHYKRYVELVPKGSKTASVKKIIVDRDAGERGTYDSLVEDLDRMGDLARLLRQRRLGRGSLDFDLPEPEVLLDLQCRPEAIVRAERSFAHIQSVWIVAPDGTGADALYKQHMNDPWALEEMRSIPDSHKISAIATGHHTLPAGPVVVIDHHRRSGRTALYMNVAAARDAEQDADE